MKPLISKDIIRGHTTTIVLNILNQTDSYGYEIAKKVKELSHSKYEINEATLYTVFRRLEKNGDISSYWGDESQGGRRKYYQITAQGKTTLIENIKAWNFAKVVIDDLILGRIDDHE
ncbi:PadR family transcriptional regulator [Companilactobacillus alimentarius]|uniref:PadR family transcriptional regulator n=1 Tax=Companilactobacillus alimentarius DSM 20249 TaxID=1423720 RepID=A0A2K9HM49_9LACO|nr:PadR family transcriptional regulator [Companilactobacillus alimentarius]AUI71033.1 PadR family transcriptional regulator [Companilactobacillus alimentarius DSM 20249]KRK75147.1 transcriptional regulator (transcriptional regulator, padr family) [Companilactobacillus alimentarius DSM 20249]MDT6951715.1 PadR family transcriptional regulator [Companilactobacillus alimentarius]GEO44077.1 PadR family transcriptional regulator [Companilactobacillus alimentarius]